MPIFIAITNNCYKYGHRDQKKEDTKMLGERKKIKHYQMIERIISLSIIIALTFINFLIVGNAMISYATELSLDMQKQETSNENVTFDAYFDSGNGSTHYLVQDVNADTQKLHMALQVKEGYLKDATIQLKEKNYQVKQIEDTANMVQEAKGDVLKLRQADSNSHTELTLDIQSKLEEKLDVHLFDKDSQVILEGTYVDKKGKEIPIHKEISVNVKLTGKYEAQITQTPKTFLTFQKDGSDKILVSMKVVTQRKDTNQVLPIKRSHLEVKVPVLNGKTPDSVNAVVGSTVQTNGKTAEEVVQKENDIQYDTNRQIVSIDVKNEEEQGKVWNGKGQDEYTITYTYPAEAWNQDNNSFQSQAKVSMELYTGDTIQAENVMNIALTKPFGQMLSLTVQPLVSQMNKGRMYANTEREEKEYNTNYSMEVKANVDEKDFVDGIRIIENGDYFEDAKGSHYNTAWGENYFITHQKIKVSQVNFEEILGKEGKIYIYDHNGNPIKQIDQTTKLDNGYYTIDGIDASAGNLIIETTKPVSAGTLSIEFDHTIQANLPYQKEQIKKFVSLDKEVQIFQKQGDNYLSVGSQVGKIALTETNTNAIISLSKDTLSTIVNNENIAIKIALDNNREETDLYTDPVFRIELPEYIEDINVKEANILYDDHLKIKDIQKFMDQGKVYLQIALDGTQNGFSTGTFTKGTNIVLNTDIKAKLLTPNKTDSIKMYYYNPNAIQYASVNQNSNQNLGETDTKVQFSAPVGMLAVNQITNYNNTGKSVVSVNQGSMVDKIGIYENAKIAKMNLLLINNTGDTCSNMIALGRFPFKGNKSILEGKNLGTTMDTKIKSAITAEGIDPSQITIYYSENGEASSDLSDTNNGWTSTPTSLENMKSFLVVLNNYEMTAGSTVTLSYDFEIPANLEHENSFYGAFAMQCVETSDIGSQNLKAEADTVGLTTGKGPKLKIDQSISVGDGQTIQEGQIVKYTIRLTNTGESDAEKVVLKDYLPSFTKYAKYQEGSGSYGEVKSGYIYPDTKTEDGKAYLDWTIGTLAPGATITKEFSVLVEKVPSLAEYYQNNLEGFGQKPGYSLLYNQDKKNYSLCQVDENGKIVAEQEVSEVPGTTAINKVVAQAKDLEKDLTNENAGNKIEKSSFSIQEQTDVDASVLLEKNQELIYTVDIRNISGQDLSNVIAEKTLPEGVTYKEAYIQTYDETNDQWNNGQFAVYTESTGRIVWKLGNMTKDESMRICLKVVVNPLNANEGSKQIKSITTVYADNVGRHLSAEVVNTVGNPVIEANIKSNSTKEYMAEGDQITYTITITNKGAMAASNLEMVDNLPEQLKFVKGTYQIDQDSAVELTGDDNTVQLHANLQANQQLVATIVAEAKNLPNDVQEKAIANFANVTGDNFDAVKTEELTNIVEQSSVIPNPPEEANRNNGDGGDNSGGNTSNGGGTNANNNKTYKIRGTVWVDQNENGARDEGEALLSGITAKLIDANSGSAITDANGNEKTVTTGNDGSYVLDGLSAGSYMVVFEYDTGKYGLTEYNKTGVNDQQNSDVIASTINENGESKEVAVTNAIKITDSSYANIDMGLINKNKFDLALEKSVTKITVQNKDGVKAYNYDHKTLPKIDIHAKKIAGSTIIIEYAITVKNEGNVAGYVKNIVDYLPEGMEFNADLNTSWYAGKDGNAYTTALADQVLQPGEAREMNIVLTKKMTNTNTGVINNRAEIYEAYNEYGLTDIDSTPGNKAQGEDDIGSADALITVKTGGAVTYTVVAIVVLFLIGFGVYIIRNKTLKDLN